MADVSLSNVINISVATAQTAAQEYNTSNVAIFTDDKPGASFGSLGYAIYLDPSTVATDFGTGAETSAMATSLFSQQPNILNNDGYLTVIPFLPSIQTLTFSGTPATGSFTLQLNGSQSVVVTATESAAAIQTAIQALAGMSQVSVTGSPTAGPITLTFYGVHGQGAVSTSGDTLQTAGSSAVTITPAITQSAETLSAAITRTQGLVQYFGLTTTTTADKMGSENVLAAASTIQALNKIGVLVSEDPTHAIGAAITAAKLTQTRILYYGSSDANALGMAAAYCGRGFSTNFDGSNTTQTLHLKPLTGVSPDPSMTQTILTNAIAAGVDTYPSIAGIAGVFCTGANKFFDQVYNLQWFVGALQVAGFNYLAQSATKVTQTEQGMSGLKGAYRAVCQQGVANQYLAPGSWTLPDTFGVQSDFLNNISTFGYYIYSSPIATQSASSRANRDAPLCQIAVKEAGAIQDSDVIIFVNA